MSSTLATAIYEERRIGTLGTYPSGLFVRQMGDKYFWRFEAPGQHCDWKPISAELFHALNKEQDQAT